VTVNRVRGDLEPWIAGAASAKATVYVIVNALHAGSYLRSLQTITAGQPRRLTSSTSRIRDLRCSLRCSGSMVRSFYCTVTRATGALTSPTVA